MGRCTEHELVANCLSVRPDSELFVAVAVSPRRHPMARVCRDTASAVCLLDCARASVTGRSR
jgi:hypothetical protein